LIFTFHHSKKDGWVALTKALLNAGFKIINAHPVWSEMAVAVPKTKANNPIHIDMIIVCKKQNTKGISIEQAIQIALHKVGRLASRGLVLSKADKKIILYGQLLRTIEKLNHIKNLDKAEDYLSDFLNKCEKIEEKKNMKNDPMSCSPLLARIPLQ